MKKNDKVNNKKFKKIKNIIEYILIFMVIFVNAALIMKSAKNPDKTPDLFGKKAFVIVSGSMIPEIQIGDVVIINDTTNVKINDIIAFRKGSTVVVHRVVDEMVIGGEVMYQTKGDNNNMPDVELVKISNIEGVYSAKIPFIGKALMFLYNNLTIVIIVIVVILILKNFVL